MTNLKFEKDSIGNEIVIWVDDENGDIVSCPQAQCLPLLWMKFGNSALTSSTTI